MTDLPDANEFGGLAPGVLDRSVIALTSRMPNNWLGSRLAILLRRISTMRLEHPAGALDVERWGMRLRLHPIDNGCDKNLLFTPQMYKRRPNLLHCPVKSTRQGRGNADLSLWI